MLFRSWRRLRTETAALHGEPHARWLCEEASGAFGDEFDDVLDEPATVRGVARLDSMIARLHEGEPLQYVLGEWSFRDLDLLVDRRVLIPRPETEVVVEVALREAERLGARVGAPDRWAGAREAFAVADRKSTRLNSSH